MEPNETFLQSQEKSPVLPWEHEEGEPIGTGICLSGGGIRAAMFSLGILQRLQERKDLVFGANSADFLSVVSGGSYMGGSHALGAIARAAPGNPYGDTDPLGAGSNEEQHILANGDYLRRDLHRYAWFGLLNLVSVAGLFGLLGLIPASIATIFREFTSESWTPDRWVAIAGAILSAAFSYAMMWVYTRSYPFPIRPLGVTLLLVGASICLYPALQYSEIDVDWNPGAWFRLIVGAMLVTLIVLTLVTMIKSLPSRLAVVVNFVALFAPRILAFIFIAWIAIWVYPDVPVAIGTLDPGALDWLEWILVGLALITLFVRGMPSGLHREYRRRLLSCYGVVRGQGGAILAPDRPISDLAPLDGHAPRSFPRLLISATANVRHKVPGKPASLFVPYLLSYDKTGAPSVEGSVFDTKQLEKVLVRSRILGRAREPMLTLFTAITCTGAAISPNMGYKTIPSIRPFIAALSFRLGRWLPNPFNARAREEVEKLHRPGHLRFWPAFGDENDELMTDLVGLYGPRMYISDGGHYDNLGILALLRARCQTIYCVDAGSDPKGGIGELKRLLDGARMEGIVQEVAFDLETSFGTRPGVPFATTHRTGTITYPGGGTADLIVLKLGLTMASHPTLLERASHNRDSRLQGAIVKWLLAGLAAGSILTMGVVVWFFPSWLLVGVALLVLLAALIGLLVLQARHENSSLNGFFPHHETFTALWFDQPLATAYRDAGREAVDRYFETVP